MRIGIMTCCVLLGAGAATTGAFGGPNEGGVLVVHCNEELVFTLSEEYCGRSNLPHCSEADVRVDEARTFVLHILAAFPDSASPRLLGTTFGIDYLPGEIHVGDTGICGQWWQFTEGWPQPGTGVAVVWTDAQTSHLTEVCWMVAYSYPEFPGTLETILHPSGEGLFYDDGNPGALDPIAGFGKMGFFTDGFNPCDWPYPTSSVDRSWGFLKVRYRK